MKPALKTAFMSDFISFQNLTVDMADGMNGYFVIFTFQSLNFSKSLHTARWVGRTRLLGRPTISPRSS